MINQKWCIVIRILFLVLINFTKCDDQNNILEENTVDDIYTPTWSYRCIPDAGCQRQESPTPITTGHLNNSIFSNVDVCRSVCGRFGGLWPRPVTAALSMQTVGIHPKFIWFDLANVPAEVRPLLVKMTQLATSNIAAECGGKVIEETDGSVTVYVTVRTPGTALDFDTDEEYVLDVQTRGQAVTAHVIAATVFGARHALESLTQLVSAITPNYDEQKCGLVMVSGAKIKDRPVYKYRGFLLDTSRNFFPMSKIKKMIDGMAATKMNVFHWHVTDSHSFPLESTRVPQLTRYGAYSASEVYSVDDVSELIEYAMVRGVRVMIEIDAPAHAGNGWQWGKEYGYGDLAVCVNVRNWRQNCIQPPCGQLNPANPEMYRVLRDLYRDIAETIPKPALFHMGGDEVYLPCWNSSQEILSYMASKGYDATREGFTKLWAEFHQKALEIWDEEYLAAGGSEVQPVMLWSSDLTQPAFISQYIDKNRYIIEVWEKLEKPLLQQLIQLGYKVVSVPKNIWYLDHGFWGSTLYSNWRRMYSHTLPQDKGGSRDGSVLGGEVAMWSEFVDEQNIDAKVWPRAAAVAERLWANPISSANSAEPRLQRLRNRLIARGLKPDVLSPEWCAHHDSKCLNGVS